MKAMDHLGIIKMSKKAMGMGEDIMLGVGRLMLAWAVMGEMNADLQETYTVEKVRLLKIAIKTNPPMNNTAPQMEISTNQKARCTSQLQKLSMKRILSLSLLRSSLPILRISSRVESKKQSIGPRYDLISKRKDAC